MPEAAQVHRGYAELACQHPVQVAAREQLHLDEDLAEGLALTAALQLERLVELRGRDDAVLDQQLAQGHLAQVGLLAVECLLQLARGRHLVGHARLAGVLLGLRVRRRPGLHHLASRRFVFAGRRLVTRRPHVVALDHRVRHEGAVVVLLVQQGEQVQAVAIAPEADGAPAQRVAVVELHLELAHAGSGVRGFPPLGRVAVSGQLALDHHLHQLQGAQGQGAVLVAVARTPGQGADVGAEGNQGAEEPLLHLRQADGYRLATFDPAGPSDRGRGRRRKADRRRARLLWHGRPHLGCFTQHSTRQHGRLLVTPSGPDRDGVPGRPGSLCVLWSHRCSRESSIRYAGPR
jgi:hypothetical protein